MSDSDLIALHRRMREEAFRKVGTELLAVIQGTTTKEPVRDQNDAGRNG